MVKMVRFLHLYNSKTDSILFLTSLITVVMKTSLLIAAFIFASILDCQSQRIEKEYQKASRKVQIREKDEFTGIEYVHIKDAEVMIRGEIKLNPYVGITEDGQIFCGMGVRVGAEDWVDGEELLIKVNGRIVHKKLGEIVRSKTDCGEYSCDNYQFYDILIDEGLLKDLAHSENVKLRVNGKFQVDDELSEIRQYRIRDLYSYLVLRRKLTINF